jgi:hypothetical protein
METPVSSPWTKAVIIPSCGVVYRSVIPDGYNKNQILPGITDRYTTPQLGIMTALVHGLDTALLASGRGHISSCGVVYRSVIPDGYNKNQILQSQIFREIIPRSFDDGLGPRTGHRAVGLGERPYLDPKSTGRREALVKRIPSCGVVYRSVIPDGYNKNQILQSQIFREIIPRSVGLGERPYLDPKSTGRREALVKSELVVLS